ncbi:hypothetical protein Tco_1544580 [Tanacetum coccineum]
MDPHVQGVPRPLPEIVLNMNAFAARLANHVQLSNADRNRYNQEVQRYRAELEQTLQVYNNTLAMVETQRTYLNNVLAENPPPN